MGCAMTTMFDLGNGPVPAHTHANGTDTPGGWVANSAFVARGIYVGPRARVSENGQVFGDLTDGTVAMDGVVPCDPFIEALTWGIR